MVALVVKSAALLTLLLFAACTHFGRGDLMPSLSERHSEKVDQIERVYGPLVLLSGYFSFTQNIKKAFNLRALIGRLLRIPLVVNQVAGLTLQSSARNYKKLSRSLFCPAFSS